MQAIINTLVNWRKNEQVVYAAVQKVLKAGSVVRKSEEAFRLEVIREAFYASTSTPKEIKIPLTFFSTAHAMLSQRTINLF